MRTSYFTRGLTRAAMLSAALAAAITLTPFMAASPAYARASAPAQKAMAAMRFHHQLLPPGAIYWEPYLPIDGELAKALQAQGYVLQKQGYNGDIEAIQIDGHRPEPAADPRGRGMARVIP